jgi:osmotically-inducible protein OsmY
MFADVDLALKVRDRLVSTRRDLGYVAVLVREGQVCLRGPVRSFHLRQVAVDHARRVQGVLHVIDEMRVEES